MVANNKLLAAPPYAIEQALKRLGGDLRTARIRRQLSLKEVAAKIGAGVRAISDAEKGKPSASMATYAALLWTFGLLGQLDAVADPAEDTEGQTLLLARERPRVRREDEGLDNDF